MKHVIILGIFGLLFCSMLSAEVVDLIPENTEINILSMNKNSVEMKVTIDAYSTTNVVEKSTDYANIFVSEWGRLTKEGYPALPSISRILIVPENGSVDIDLTVHHTVEYSDVMPYPAQPPAVDNDVFDTPPFTIDNNYYTSGSVYPEKPYSVSETFIMRGIPFVYIRIHPFQYDASTKTLLVIDDFDVSVNISGELMYDQRLYSQYFTPAILSSALNPDMIQPAQNSFKNADGADLIIVTTYEFSDAAETLKEWKSQKGFYTDIAYIEDIGSTEQYIYTYLFIAYETWVLPPSFVLFLGDVEYVPTNYIPDQVSGGYLGTDRPYVCMDSGFHPDIGYGRISVDDGQQALSVVHKIIDYEKTPPSLQSFYNQAINAGYFQDDEHDGYETRRFIKTSEEIRDFLLSEEYDSERIYVTEGSVNPTNYNNGYYANGEPIPDELLRVNGFPWNGNSTDISNAINAGSFLLVHRDHGYTGGWGDPSYNIGNVQQLTNGDLLPMVFSINCQTGWFDSETDGDPSTFESFCEEFLRKEDGGAVSTIGACRNSMSGYNDYFSLGMIDGMWDNFFPSWGTETEGYLSLVMIKGLLAMEQLWGGSLTQYQYSIFHVLGDPTLQVWRVEPEEITATHETSFPYNVTSIPITASIDDGIASLVVDGELVGKAEFTDFSFDLYLTENLTYPQSGVITITSRDHAPYIQTVTFIPPDGSYVVIEDFNISDENGNNDGEWDVGEDITLIYELKNVGNQAVDEINFSIAADVSQLQIYDPSTQITGLLPGESIFYSSDALISMNCLDQEIISIEGSVENPDGEFIDVKNIVVIKQPKIALDINSIYYEMTEPGIVEIPFEINNIGADTLYCDLTNNSHQCADLYQDNTYMTMPHVTEFENLSEFTVMMWLNVQNISQPGFVLTKGVINGDLSFIVSIPNMSSILYKFRDAAGSDLQRIVSYPLVFGEWFHLAIVVDETTITSYINGEEMISDPFISPIFSTPDDVLVGTYINSTYEFNGFIDELALYTIALTDTEIGQKMVSTIRGSETGLLSYYQLDSNTQSTDYTGFNNMIETGSIPYDLSGAPITTWVGCGTYSVVVMPNESEPLNIIFNTEGYSPQLFSSTVDIFSNASNADEIIIPVELLYQPSNIDNHAFTDYMLLHFRNPFGPGQAIKFSIHRPQKVNIDIFNMRGQFVNTIVDDALAPQEYELQWSGRDLSGNIVENGVYFLKIQTDDVNEIRKLVFLR